MKANELMLGDWVVGNNKQPFQIGVINPFFKYWDEVHPIPLTSEILEKSGYSYNENREAWEQIPNDGFGVCKDEDDNCFYFCLGIFDAFNRRSDITYHYVTKVEYVHELQHALRLCKTEKEIIL